MKLSKKKIRILPFLLMVIMAIFTIFLKMTSFGQEESAKVYIESDENEDTSLSLWKIDSYENSYNYEDPSIKLEKTEVFNKKDKDILNEEFGDSINLSGLDSFAYENDKQYLVFDLKEIPEGVYYVRNSSYSFILTLPSFEKKIYPKKNNISEKEIILEKVDSKNSDIKLEGAIFKLYKISGNKEEIVKTTNYSYDPSSQNLDGEELVSDKNGIIKVTNLPSDGTYFFKEIKSPESYKIKGDGKSKTVRTGEKLVIENEKENFKGKRKFVKVSSLDNNKKLQGAEFNVYKDGDDKAILSVKSLEDGSFEVNNLDYGKYYLRETKAPEGYILNGEKIYFDISENNDDVVETQIIENKPKTTITTSNKTKNKANPSKTITVPKTGDIVLILMCILGFVMILGGAKLILEKDKVR